MLCACVSALTPCVFGALILSQMVGTPKSCVTATCALGAARAGCGVALAVCAALVFPPGLRLQKVSVHSAHATVLQRVHRP